MSVHRIDIHVCSPPPSGTETLSKHQSNIKTLMWKGRKDSNHPEVSKTERQTPRKIDSKHPEMSKHEQQAHQKLKIMGANEKPFAPKPGAVCMQCRFSLFGTALVVRDAVQQCSWAPLAACNEHPTGRAIVCAKHWSAHTLAHKMEELVPHRLGQSWGIQRQVPILAVGPT